MIFRSLSTPSRLDRYDSRWSKKSRLGLGLGLELGFMFGIESGNR